MSDLIFKTKGKETFRIPFPTPGTKCPETQLEIKMTEPITLNLTLEELKLIDKYVEYSEETKELFDKIKYAYPKPETLTDVIWNWWEDVFTTNSNDDMETSIDDLVFRIEAWIPKEQSAAGSQNAYVECTVEGFNDCLSKIKGKLR